MVVCILLVHLLGSCWVGTGSDTSLAMCINTQMTVEISKSAIGKADDDDLIDEENYSIMD